MGKYAPIVPGVGLLDALKDGWQEMPIRHLRLTPCVTTSGAEVRLSEQGLSFHGEGVTSRALTWESAAQLAKGSKLASSVQVRYAWQAKQASYSPEELKIPLSYVTGTRLSGPELPGRVALKNVRMSPTGPVEDVMVLPVEVATSQTVSFVDHEEYPVELASEAYIASDDELAGLGESLKVLDEAGAWLSNWYKEYPRPSKVASGWWKAAEKRCAGTREATPLKEVLDGTVELPSPFISDARLRIGGMTPLYEVAYLFLEPYSRSATWGELAAELAEGARIKCLMLRSVHGDHWHEHSALEGLFVDGLYTHVQPADAASLGRLVRIEAARFEKLSCRTYSDLGPLKSLGRRAGVTQDGEAVGFGPGALRMVADETLSRHDAVLGEYQQALSQLKAWWQDRMTVADYLQG